MAAIEPLVRISPSAKAVCDEIFDSNFEQSVFGHLQTSLYASADSIKRENLSQLIGSFAKVRKKLGAKSEDRFSAALDCTIRELVDKFSLQLNLFDENPAASVSDFRRISIVSEATLKAPCPDLAKNRIRGSFPSLETYLKTHFMLLMEDFLTPLRDGLSKISGNAQKSDHELYSYGKVTYVDLKVGYDKLSATFQLDEASFDVESSQRLMSGSLVVVVVVVDADDETSFHFGTVVDKTSRCVDIAFFNSEDLLKVGSTSPGNCRSFRLYESPVYYEAYCHVLTCLQQTDDVPFLDKLIEANREVLAPSYLTGNAELNISALYEKSQLPYPDKKCYSTEMVS